MGAQESIAKAAIATLVPSERRARAYGWFFAAFGLAWWLGSWGMGALYARSLPAVAALSAAAQLLAIPLLLGLAARLSAARAEARPPAP
jgi:MFS family permease